MSRHLLLAVFLGLFALVLLIVSMMSNGWFVMELHTHLEGNQTTWDVHGSLWYGLREVEQINRSVENGDVVSRNSLALNYADVYGREFPNFMNVATVTYGILWVALILLLVTILLTFLASMGVHGRTSPRTRYLLGAMTVSCIVLMWIAMAHFALHFPESLRGHWSYQDYFDSESLGFSFYIALVSTFLLFGVLTVLLHPESWKSRERDPASEPYGVE